MRSFCQPLPGRILAERLRYGQFPMKNPRILTALALATLALAAALATTVVVRADASGQTVSSVAVSPAVLNR